ncbi:MAG: hypothetical protein Q9171_001777 [Xanthocarpia ochracea]
MATQLHRDLPQTTKIPDGDEPSIKSQQTMSSCCEVVQKYWSVHPNACLPSHPFKQTSVRAAQKLAKLAPSIPLATFRRDIAKAIVERLDGTSSSKRSICSRDLDVLSARYDERPKSKTVPRRHMNPTSDAGSPPRKTPRYDPTIPIEMGRNMPASNQNDAWEFGMESGTSPERYPFSRRLIEDDPSHEAEEDLIGYLGVAQSSCCNERSEVVMEIPYELRSTAIEHRLQVPDAGDECLWSFVLEAYVDPSFQLRNMSSILGYNPSVSEEMLEADEDPSGPNSEARRRRDWQSQVRRHLTDVSQDRKHLEAEYSQIC